MNDIEATGSVESGSPAKQAPAVSASVFKVAKPGRNAPEQPVTLTVGNLTVWRTNLTELRASMGKAADLDLFRSPVRPRLAAAARLQLRTRGEAFLDSPQTIQLTIGEPGERQEIVVMGRDIVDRLDMVPDPASGRLIDGEPRPRARPADGVRVVAYYLPQFYPFAVNDLAWGEGFTEWTNVISAQPQYAGHHMPLLPADLGFYDIRLADVRRRQADLAAQYGVDAFCYHYYWFSGRRVMEEGLDEILFSGEPSTSFCLCWANETWSRRWDGTESEMLIEQQHDPAIDATLVDDLLPYFADERYLTVDGSPMLVIYRLGIMNEPEQVIAAWKAAAVAAGFPGLFVVAARTFGLTDAQAALVDAVVEFPPHGSVAHEIQGEVDTAGAFEGKVYDYREAVVNAACEPPNAYTCFPAIMPRWDNTARRGNKSHSFLHSSPGAFQLWTSVALARAEALPSGRRFLFINSWNEWAEGAMLEPDRHHGRAYLEALRRARSGYVVNPDIERRFRLVSGLPDDGATQFLNGFTQSVTMLTQMVTRMHTRQPTRLRQGPPELMSFQNHIVSGGLGHLDYVAPGADLGRIIVAPGQIIDVVGWAMMDKGVPHRADRIAYLTLTDLATGSIAFHYAIWNWRQRLDVRDANQINLADDDACFGFQVKTVIDDMPVGEYEMHMIQPTGGSLIRVSFSCRVVRI